ncbi:MAG: cupin domain-containing protein [Nitrococcus mobilis]|nr:cupin domain-containing protein [Nitrococcus mobilis]
MDKSKVVRAKGYRWQGVPLREYKAEGSHFQAITRQSLLGEGADEQAINFLTRYFELQPGGYSTLEHHQHPHTVVVLRGSGEVILGNRVEAIDRHDCIYIAPGAFHQFHASRGEPLGFLCIVDRHRDRPALPTQDELEQLRRNDRIRQRMRI